MKVASIEFLRGFAVSIVIAFHMYAVQERYFGVNVLPEFFKYGGWGVDIFFVISGVVMFKSGFGRSGTVSPWPFLKARISRIYPPYWVITFVILAIYVISPSMVNSSYDQKPSIIWSLLLLPDVTTPWLNVGWSLVYEMWFYLLLSGLLWLPKRMAILALIAYGCFLVISPNFTSAGPILSLVSDALILEFLFGFAIGAVLFQLDFPRKGTVLLGGAAIFGFLAFAILAFEWLPTETKFERFATYGLWAIATVCITLCLETVLSHGRIFQPVIFIGKISYSVYLTHVLFLNLFLYVTIRVFHLGLPVLLANIGCFLFTLFCGAIYYRLVENTTSHHFKQLLGNVRFGGSVAT